MSNWYSVNKLSVTQNSPVVTGTGTQFSTFVRPGYGIFINKVAYEVASVDSLTQITLTEPYAGATSGAANYSIWPTQALNYEVWQNTTDLMETFGPLRNNMTLLTQQITDTATYKDQAAGSANTAAQKAGEAQNSANTASGHATNAGNSAGAAAGSATAANTSRTNAATSETNAAKSASDANAHKQAAAASAADALTNKNTTDTLKGQAETARDAAIGARDASVVAKDAAVVARGAAENARDTAAGHKTAAQTAQGAAETARDAALAHRNAAEAAKQAAESSEADAAGSASAAGTAKADAETARNTAITARNEAVAARDVTEGHRTAAETARQGAENAQTAAELAAARAEEPVNPGAIEDALGGTPALTKGATFTGSVTIENNAPLFFLRETDAPKTWITVADGGNYSIREDTTASANQRLIIEAGSPKVHSTASGNLLHGTNTVYHTGNFNPATKLDKSGGTVTGDLSATGNIKAESYVKAVGNLVVQASAGDPEGGQIVIGKKGRQNLSGQGSSTWNIDSDANDDFRIFDLDVNGLSGGTQLSINRTDGVKVSGDLELRDSSPTIYFRDTDHRAGMIHVQNNTMHFLRGAGTDTRSWESIEGRWPLTLNLENNDASFGGGVFIRGNTAWHSGNLVNVSQLTNNANYITSGGRAYPRKNDGGNLNFNWSGQSGQPPWLWGGSDGNNMFVYNPSNFSVANSGQLNSIGGGNQGGYIRRTQDINGNGGWSRQLVLAGGDVTNDIWSAPIEIREVGGVGNGSTGSERAPGILFHWSNVVGGALKMHADGSFRFQAQGTSINYRDVWMNEINPTGWTRPRGDVGIYWQDRSRGITVADAGSSYGNITTWGAGNSGWQGYSIGGYASFMANNNTCGIYSQNNGRWMVSFDNSGNATFSANVTAYSDRRFKQNIRPIDNVAERRKAMAEASALYERDGETRVGFIAQDLQEHMPEVVRKGDDMLETLSVNYMDTIAVLAADNQQQEERIQALEYENTQLRTMLEALENRMKKAGI